MRRALGSLIYLLYITGAWLFASAGSIWTFKPCCWIYIHKAIAKDVWGRTRPRIHIYRVHRTGAMFPRTFKEVFVRAVVSSYGSLLIELAIAGHKYLVPPTHLLELELYKLSWSTIDDVIPTVEVPRLKFVKFGSSGISYLP